MSLDEHLEYVGIETLCFVESKTVSFRFISYSKQIWFFVMVASEISILPDALDMVMMKPGDAKRLTRRLLKLLVPSQQ